LRAPGSVHALGALLAPRGQPNVSHRGMVVPEQQGPGQQRATAAPPPANAAPPPAGTAIKEGLCYGKAEAAVLAALTPTLLLAHLAGLSGWQGVAGVSGADAERGLLAAALAACSVFALRCDSGLQRRGGGLGASRGRASAAAVVHRALALLSDGTTRQRVTCVPDMHHPFTCCLQEVGAAHQGRHWGQVGVHVSPPEAA
jgi:hypothetical protein